MKHSPESVIWEVAKTESPEAMAQEDGNLSRKNRDEHVDDKWNRRKPRQETDQDQSTKDDFYYTDERSHHVRRRDADSSKPAGAILTRIEKLLNTFRQKNPADDQPDQEHGARRVGINDLSKVHNTPNLDPSSDVLDVAHVIIAVPGFQIFLFEAHLNIDHNHAEHKNK